MEKVDYTNRISNNRRNIEYANTRVPENYDRMQQGRHFLNQAKNKIKSFDRNVTGIGAFANKGFDFLNARKENAQNAVKEGTSFKNMYGVDQAKDDPYKRDIFRWLGNNLYQGAEMFGDVGEMALQSVGTASAKLGNAVLPGSPFKELIPGDRGVGGEYYESLQYNPDAKLLGFLPNILYNEENRNKLDKSFADASKQQGYFETAYRNNDWEGVMSDTNFLNHLRGQYGFDSDNFDSDKLVPALGKFIVDDFESQYDGENQTFDFEDGTIDIPTSFIESRKDYSNDELTNSYMDESKKFINKKMNSLANSYSNKSYGNISSDLADEYNLSENTINNLLPTGQETDYLHMGLFEDFMAENTMPFMPDNFQFDYETPEAESMAESYYSHLPALSVMSGGLGAVKRASQLLSKSRNPYVKGTADLTGNIFPNLTGKRNTFETFNFPSGKFTGKTRAFPFRKQGQMGGILGINTYSETGE